MSVDNLTPDEIERQIAQLDSEWAGAGVTCQCTDHSEPCEAQAVVTMEKHAVGHCSGPDTSELGNTVHLLCLYCAHHAYQEAWARVARVRAEAAKYGARPHCRTCQAPMAEVGDLVRSMLHFPNGIR